MGRAILRGFASSAHPWPCAAGTKSLLAAASPYLSRIKKSILLVVLAARTRLAVPSRADDDSLQHISLQSRAVGDLGQVVAVQHSPL